MNREKLIAFAKFLDEGCDLLGEGYIETKTDQWLQNSANSFFTQSDKEKLIESYIKEGHTQEECIGFIDGLQKALTLINQTPC
jgi:hypothetical protein